jgi:rod shape determining protein RodA
MAFSDKQQFNWSDFDRLTLTLYTALVVVGWMMIYAVNYIQEDPYAFASLSHPAGKQLAFIVLCFAMLFFLLMVDWSFWRTFAAPVYAASMLLMFGTIFLGREVNGALAWYQFGGFSFQPAEIAKFATCLMMASYLGSPGTNLQEWRSMLSAFAIMLLPVGVIILQKDTGSALVFFSFLLVLYREGLSPFWYIVGFSMIGLVILGVVVDPAMVVTALLALFSARLIRAFSDQAVWWWAVWLSLLAVAYYWSDILMWSRSATGFDPADLPESGYLMALPFLLFFLVVFIKSYLRKNQVVQRKLQGMVLLLGLASLVSVSANLAVNNVLAPHQRSRIYVWLKPTHPSVDPRGSAYNLLHSKMAIGSGGLMGKGYLQGNMTTLNYVPEQSTDFIFCTIGEQQGFVGVVAIVTLFTLLLLRIVQLAERQRSNFSRLYAYGVAGVIFVHVMINIGMTMGLFPIIGIPLPFISAGGSSLIGFTLMVGVLLKLDNHRNAA